MRVLIVETNQDLAGVWSRSLERQGVDVIRAHDEDAAIRVLDQTRVDVIVMNVHLKDGNALALADYAEFRTPHTRVIFVTNSSFFSDGSIFNLARNAHAFIADQTPVEDLTALVEFHGAHACNAAE
ncbi:Response regulator receiver domain-containing protein [Aliiroseovarius crassostreae]|uniref:Chemotaxis protein CheY n=1 Tax=Aliiroseovarius crassostreae TaxID=154981 RepID=A0A0P7IYS0_9RHOB|nr:response regulator [Aliiroseovarius crassostreae]KPN63920.1 chemotaxis protein CheY [Aliiroseovarius crassostreae]SFU49513.1 Response regulator receiver domain-containing protein [Aliiroseovarius crassostreae]